MFRLYLFTFKGSRPLFFFCCVLCLGLLGLYCSQMAASRLRFRRYFSLRISVFAQTERRSGAPLKTQCGECYQYMFTEPVRCCGIATEGFSSGEDRLSPMKVFLC